MIKKKQFFSCLYIFVPISSDLILRYLELIFVKAFNGIFKNNHTIFLKIPQSLLLLKCFEVCVNTNFLRDGLTKSLYLNPFGSKEHRAGLGTSEL